MLVDRVDVMFVQIVIEMYMLCEVHKEDEIGLLGSKLSILQKNVKKREKTSKNAKNAKTPVNPCFFAFFQKPQISFETSIGIFPQKRVFSCFLGGPAGPGFWGLGTLVLGFGPSGPWFWGSWEQEGSEGCVKLLK